MTHHTLSAALLVSAGLQLAFVVQMWAAQARWGRVGRLAPRAIAVAAGVEAAVQFGPARTLAVVVVVAFVLAGATHRLGSSSTSGAMVLTNQLVIVAATMAWGVVYVMTVPVSAVTRALMLGAAPLALVAMPISLVRTYENWEVLCRRVWRRPRAPLPREEARDRSPRVSVHVPTHAEPPEVVIATLDSLARLDYPNYEVIVLDNNTADPSLWRPVAEHCARLGEGFRFFHVEGVAGVKAGALNLALDHTDPSAELVATVDADYQVEPHFLADMVPFFDDPQLGFVQSPHAYRDWQQSRFLRMCNWEYAFFFNTGMISLNERNAGLTVGTMCVIRKDAVEDAGRWAEWCLTEDSELAIRIHALGYSSVYLPDVYGRGLIPPTFHGYRRQRFRWTYGPVQELHRHWRLFLPGRWRQPSQLTVGQRLHHLTHGLHGVLMAASAATVPLMLAVAASMIVHREHLPLPVELWAAATSTLAVGFVHRWLVYRSIGANVGQWVGATVASMALTFVIILASITGVLGRIVPWQRTDKFPKPGRGVRALDAVRAESATGIALIGAAGAIAVLGSGRGLTGMLAVGLVLHATVVLASPIVTLIAEHSLRRQQPAPAAAWSPPPDERLQPASLAGSLPSD